MSVSGKRVDPAPLTLAGDDVPSPRRNRPYAKTFEERRGRILAIAWDLLAERGDDDFSLAELSEQADVSLRTIYNAFTDKEGVIAQAVATHYRSLFADIRLGDNESCLLADAMVMIDRVATETCRVRGWSATGARMYFSPRTGAEIVDSLRAMPVMILKAWARSSEAERKRLQLFDSHGIERSFANAQWALVNDWSAGRIDSDDLAREMKRNLVVLAAAFGNRAGRSEAIRLGEILA